MGSPLRTIDNTPPNDRQAAAEAVTDLLDALAQAIETCEPTDFQWGDGHTAPVQDVAGVLVFIVNDEGHVMRPLARLAHHFTPTEVRAILEQVTARVNNQLHRTPGKD